MIEENKLLKREAEKELKKVQTEKLEYNRWLREEARDEMITDRICVSVSSLTPLKVPDYIPPVHNARAYALIYSDEHYSAEFELKGLFGDIINAYSPEIFEKRMWDLLCQTVEIVKKENIDTLNVFFAWRFLRWLSKSFAADEVTLRSNRWRNQVCGLYLQLAE